MIAAMVFHPIAPLWVLAIVTVIVGGWLLWMEAKKNRRFKLMRIIAQLVVIFSLLALCVRPSLDSEEMNNPVLVLTEGYNKKIADSLLAKQPDLKVYAAPNAENYKSATVLKSWREITEHSGNVSFVVGTGIPAAVLDVMPEKNFRFLPARYQSGYAEIVLPPFYADRVNTIHGRYTSKAKFTTLKLTGPAGAEDSIKIPGGKNYEFSLSFSARHSGNYLYQITDSISTEILPIEILPAQKLSILFLQKYPTADTKYLKNYLASKNHSLVIGYQVSQNIFRYEYINHPPLKGIALTGPLLSSFDLVITDGEVINHLTPGEKLILEAQIKKGLGMISLITDKQSSSSLLPFSFSAASQNDTVHVRLLREKIELHAFASGASEGAELHEVTTTTGRRWVAGWKSNGLGKTGVQLLENTWSLLLKGNSDAYGEIWSPLIEQVAGRKRSEFKISVTPSFPVFTDDAATAHIISSGQQPKLKLDSIPVALKEDVTWDDLWTGEIWPDQKGWHQLSIQNDSSHYNFYSFEPGSWQSLYLSRQIILNQSFNPGQNGINTIVRVEKEIPLIIFFLLFLLASGFLWLAPKL